MIQKFSIWKHGSVNFWEGRGVENFIGYDSGVDFSLHCDPNVTSM